MIKMTITYTDYDGVEKNEYQYFKMRKKTGYCPICDKDVEVRTNDSMVNCPDCGHHLAMHNKE